MNFKLIFCVIFFSISYIDLFAQSYSKDDILECDTLTQTGYLITIYEKKFIKEFLKNKKRKNENKSYELIYPLSGLNICFISDDSIKKHDEFLTVINNRFKYSSTSIYTLYGSLNSVDFKFLRGLDHEFLSKWPDNTNFNYYELVREKSRFCFQIYLMTAQWVRFKVRSIGTAYNFVGREARWLDKNESYYDIYILKKVIEYNATPELKNLPIKLWMM